MSMAVGIGLWLTKWAATNTAKAALERFLSKSVQKEIDKVITEWANELPPEAHVHASSLNLDPARTSVGLQGLEALGRLGECFAEGRLPHRQLWLAALVEQREQIRSTLGADAQAYYLLTAEEAKPYLEDLACRIDLKCREQEALFRTHTSQKIDSLSAQLDAVLHLLADNVNDEITEAFEFTKKGQPDVTLVQLDRIRSRKWGKLDGHTRYRLLANRGNALYALGKPEEAGRDYLLAHSHDPEDENARALEALAHMFLEDDEKAFTLAEALCTEKPLVSKAHAVRIRTAPKSLGHDALFESVPSTLREDPEILMALYQRATTEGLYEVAEAHVRRVCESSPDWAEARQMLASGLLQRALRRIGIPISPDSVSNLPEDARRPVIEARDTLSSLLKRLGDHWKHSRAMAHFNRAAAHGLLGDKAERVSDLRTAQRIEPIPEHALALGRALDEAGDLNSAIGVFREQCEREGDRRIRVLLAMSLRDRNEPGDLKAAVEVLKADPKEEAEGRSNIISRADVLQLLVSLICDSEGVQAASDYVESLNDQNHALLAPLLRVDLLLKQGAQDEAKALVLEQFESREGASRAELRLLARALQRVGEHSAALPIWEGLAGEESDLSPEIFELLQCARQAGSDGVVRDRCRALRESGSWVKDIAYLEIDTLLKYQEYREAVPLLIDYLDRCPSDVHARINLSILGIQLDQPDLVDTDPESYPKASDVSPDLGKAIADIIASGPEGTAALNYAYELVRRNPDSPEAHQALIILCLPGLRGRPVDTPKPEVVAPGVAVEVLPAGGRPKRWIVIEDDEDPPPSRTRSEYGPDSPLARALLGKRVGEEGDLPLSFGTVPARIERLASKFDYRAQTSLSTFETKFPEASFVTGFRAPEPPPAGPKTLRDVLGDEAVDLLSRSEQLREETKRLYRTHSVPVAALVDLGSKTYLEVHGFLAGSSDVELRCSLGRTEDFQAASGLSTAKSLVLDESALATLFLLDRTSVLNSLGECLVPEVFLSQLRSWLEKNPAEKGEIIAIGSEAGEPRLTRIAKEVVTQQREATEAYLSLLESSCTPFGGGELAYCQAADRRWLDELSPGTSHALAFASRSGLPIYTDDFAVASLGREIGVTERTWTQAVFIGLKAADKAEQADVDDVSMRLNALGYRFTSMSPSAVKAALQATEWDLDQEPASSALAHFREGMDQAVLVGFIAGVLREVWAEAPERSRVPITVRVLEHVSNQPAARRLLFRLARQTDQIFRFEPIMAARVRNVIETWLAGTTTGSALILPPTPGQLLALASSGSLCPRCGSESLPIVLRVGGQSLVCCEKCRPA